MSEILNAKITATTFGVEDHGILTCWLYLEWEGGGVGFGGYSLDGWSQKDQKRIGSGLGLDFLTRIMEVVGVEKWEDLKGKYIRLETEGYAGGMALGIGNLIKDEWLHPKEFFK